MRSAEITINESRTLVDHIHKQTGDLAQTKIDVLKLSETVAGVQKKHWDHWT